MARVVAPALLATYEDAGLPNEIDWDTRLAACAVWLLCFKQHRWNSDEKARELLDASLPERFVRENTGAVERDTADKAFRALRAKHWEQRRYAPMRGLYALDLPHNLVLPWEDYDAVVANERPADITPDEFATHPDVETLGPHVMFQVAGRRRDSTPGHNAQALDLQR